MRSPPRHDTPASAPSGLVLGRRSVIVAGSLATLLVAWAGTTTWYIAARDELAQHIFVRETEMKYAYEDRIGQIAGRLEREVTQNMVERTSFDARVAALAARQAEIETRQSWLRAAAGQAGLAPADRGTLSSGPAPARATAARAPGPQQSAKPAPLPEAGLRLRGGGAEGDTAGPRDRLSALERSLERIDGEGLDLAKKIGLAARSRLAHLRTVIDATGLEPPAPAGPERGMGGPLVPLGAQPAAAGPFAFLVADVEQALGEIRRLDTFAQALPLRLPLAGEAEQTSGFGYRMDPFTRAPALHTGVDFRSDSGTPARAAGAGRVVSAEYAGGYGNLVEIDHGAGVTTRYGHLQSFTVAPGQRVDAGQIVGLTGSTGRSTGPHLHYETRIGGEPVNPVRFLEAGKLLRRGDS